MRAEHFVWNSQIRVVEWQGTPWKWLVKGISYKMPWHGHGACFSYSFQHPYAVSQFKFQKQNRHIHWHRYKRTPKQLIFIWHSNQMDFKGCSFFLLFSLSIETKHRSSCGFNETSSLHTLTLSIWIASVILVFFATYTPFVLQTL